MSNILAMLLEKSMNDIRLVTDTRNLLGEKIAADAREFSSEIAWNDHKIRYVVERVAGKSVLDLGCVCHDPANYQSKFWLHRAIVERAAQTTGMDLSQSGVDFLQARGFNVHFGDAQSFDVAGKFDVIVAGDLIEHLEDFSGFLKSCKRHLKPDGRIIISTPNPWYWRNVVKSILALEVANNPEHTCWLCPRTLRQLAARHGLELKEIQFGSRFLRDRLLPLPRGIKHTSWHACLVNA